MVSLGLEGRSILWEYCPVVWKNKLKNRRTENKSSNEFSVLLLLLMFVCNWRELQLQLEQLVVEIFQLHGTGGFFFLNQDK